MDLTSQHQQPPAASQTSSHFHLDPVSGAILFEQEARRRDLHTSRGRVLTTGCREVDVEVLCGGFERGCVVGISAEEGQGEENIGLVLALQTLAKRYVSAVTGPEGKNDATRPRAMVITTLSMGALLPLVKDVFWRQLAFAVGGGGGQMGHDREVAMLKGFLERVQVARVFDVPGLWEALGDLDRADNDDGDDGTRVPEASPTVKAEDGDVEVQPPMEEDPAGRKSSRPRELGSSSPLSDPPSSLDNELPWKTTDAAEDLLRKTPPGHRDEIQDSEDEGEGALSPLSSGGDASHLSTNQPPENAPIETPAHSDGSEPLEGPSRQVAIPPEPPRPTTADIARDRPHGETSSRRPDTIIITHMSNLLSTLFQQREKSTAHQTLQLLSSHLRYLSRAPEHGGPLILLLNSTTSSDNSNLTGGAGGPDRLDRPPPPPADDPPTTTTSGNKALDPTLRSIFNPPPLPVSGLNYSYDTPHSRRNKPSFGLIFTQMLDLHLLCTRVPKSRDDAEALFAPNDEGAKKSVAYGWVIEVLLDEIGVWDGRNAVEGGRKRKSREQRWGAVEIRRSAKGIALADLFGRSNMSGDVVVAAGFGGPRV